MQTEILTLQSPSPGAEHRLTVHRYGRAGARPKAYIQAALHADEVPPLLVAQQLRARLQALEEQGAVRGEVVLLPYANPLGLAQQLLGQHPGRFDLGDGLNFNRHFADLGAVVADALRDRLGGDAQANDVLIRDALRTAAQQLLAERPAQDLKRRLLQLAVDSDIVLDLHCDGEAALHLYALTPQADRAAELGALLGVRAVLLATDSGDSPFDEACSRPWLHVQQQCPEAAVPLGCFAVTVELRGQADTRHAWAARDADALIEFLCRQGVVDGAPAPLPAPLCVPTPLAGSEPVVAPHAGVVVFHAEPGDTVLSGAVVADVVDIDSGRLSPVTAPCAGLLYARSATRWAAPGARLAKIAGSAATRSGKLLGP